MRVQAVLDFDEAPARPIEHPDRLRRRGLAGRRDPTAKTLRPNSTVYHFQKEGFARPLALLPGLSQCPVLVSPAPKTVSPFPLKPAPAAVIHPLDENVSDTLSLSLQVRAAVIVPVFPQTLPAPFVDDER